MLSSCTPSEVVRTLRYVFFGCFCYQSSCLLIYLGTGVFIQMLGHENNSKHVVLPRSTPYLDLVHGPPSVHTEQKLGSGGWGKEPKEAWDCLGLERLTRSPPLRLPRECEEWKVHSKAKRDACHGREMRGKRAATRVYNYTANTLASTRARPSSTRVPHTQ